MARYEPAAVSPTLDERTYIRERFVYHVSGSGESFSIGATGMDAPLARFIDDNGDGDYQDAGDRIDYYLTTRRGDVVAIMGPRTDTSSTPDGIADEPGELRARARYSAFGVPTFVHPLDMDGDGLVRGTQERASDLVALLEALDHAGASRGWTNLGNVAQVTCITSPCTSDWEQWVDDQVDYFNLNYPTSVIDLKSDFGNTPLYAGYWWDKRLELYHIRHRVYSPLAGRFLQRDPIGYAGGLNLYMYVGKGLMKRAEQSAMRLAEEYGDEVEFIDWTPAKNDREGFKQEHRRLDKDGGPENNLNYNRINSPGKNYCKQDGG